MEFTIAIWKRFKLIIRVLDIDPTDGNIKISLEVSWK